MLLLPGNFRNAAASIILQALFTAAGIMVDDVRNLCWPRLFENFVHKMIIAMVNMITKLIETDIPIANERCEDPVNGRNRIIKRSLWQH